MLRNQQGVEKGNLEWSAVRQGSKNTRGSWELSGRDPSGAGRGVGGWGEGWGWEVAQMTEVTPGTMLQCGQIRLGRLSEEERSF